MKYLQPIIKNMLLEAGLEDSNYSMNEALKETIGAESVREYAAFILGQNFESANNEVDRAIPPEESYEEWQASQEREFNKRNCMHIVK